MRPAGTMPFGMGNTPSSPNSSSKQEATSFASVGAGSGESIPVKRRSRSSAPEIATGGGGGSDDSSSSKSGDEALDALMAQLGGAPAEEMMEGGRRSNVEWRRCTGNQPRRPR